MPSNSFSIVIGRPVQAVFAYMDDVNKEREWQPAIRSASTDPEGPTEVGTKKSYTSEFMGRDVTNTYVAKVVERNKRVVYETTPQSTIQATAAFSWEPVEEGTRVTMSVEGKPKGVLRFIPKGVLDRVYQNEIQSTLERLKTRLEASD